MDGPASAPPLASGPSQLFPSRASVDRVSRSFLLHPADVSASAAAPAHSASSVSRQRGVCSTCNGYYGPAFCPALQPVCATCHAFLYANDLDAEVNLHLSAAGGGDEADQREGADDDSDRDSGNEEPTDQEPDADDNPAAAAAPPPVPVQEDPQPQQPLPEQLAGEEAAAAVGVAEGVLENVPEGAVGVAPDPVEMPVSPAHALAGANRSDSPDTAFLRQVYWNMSDPPTHCRSAVPPQKGLLHAQDQPIHVESLSERLALLSVPRGVAGGGGGGGADNSLPDGLVDSLPPEVLLAIFSHLDDISLYAVGHVCRRWYNLLKSQLPSEQWQVFTRRRWPLFRPLLPSALPYLDQPESAGSATAAAAISAEENGDGEAVSATSFSDSCTFPACGQRPPPHQQQQQRDWFSTYSALIESSFCLTCIYQMAERIPLSDEDDLQPPPWREKRLGHDLRGLVLDPPEGIKAQPLDSSNYHWQASITGPVGSPYEGGIFFLYLKVPFTYPFTPPEVRFLTRIFHPNVSRHGDIGIDNILQHNWVSGLTIPKVLISIQSLLTDPYCQVCMEPDIGALYRQNRTMFDAVARLWTWKFALHDAVPPKPKVS